MLSMTGYEVGSRVGGGIAAGAGYIGNKLYDAMPSFLKRADDKDYNLKMENEMLALQQTLKENEVEEDQWVLID